MPYLEETDLGIMVLDWPGASSRGGDKYQEWVSESGESGGEKKKHKWVTKNKVIYSKRYRQAKTKF